MERSPSGETTTSSVQKWAILYRTRRLLPPSHLANCPYPPPDDSIQCSSILFRYLWSILILSSYIYAQAFKTASFLQVSPPKSFLPHASHTPHTSPPWSDHPHNIWQGAYVTNFLNTQFSPTSSSQFLLPSLSTSLSTLFWQTISQCSFPDGTPNTHMQPVAEGILSRRWEQRGPTAHTAHSPATL